jgi:hypothetical protein
MKVSFRAAWAERKATDREVPYTYFDAKIRNSVAQQAVNKNAVLLERMLHAGCTHTVERGP